jgi:hypothetical protein
LLESSRPKRSRTATHGGITDWKTPCSSMILEPLTIPESATTILAIAILGKP